jgi:alcohol dehydrogenase (cytochrome c)
VASANKDGLLSAIDRSAVRAGGGATTAGSSLPPAMTLLFQTPTTTRENVETPLSADAPVRFCPGTQGGSEWNGPAYDSSRNLLFVGATDWCSTVQVRRRDTLGGSPGTFWSGATQGFGTTDPLDKRQGWLTAIDADTGAVKWKYRSTLPMVAGVTPTAGGIVFTGEMNGDAVAFDAASGKELWRQATGNAIGGGVVTYRAGGRQLVAMAAGFKSAVWRAPAESNRVIVFGLP